MRTSYAVTAASVFALMAAAHAADLQQPVFVNSSGMDPSALPIEWEAGTRYWYSTGRYTKDLYNGAGTTQLSKLVYGDLDADSAEGYFRADIARSFFVKGVVGGGSVTGGKMNDYDYNWRGTGVTSNTLSKQKNGNIRHFNADIGYSVYGGGYAGLKDRPAGWTWRVGGFAGYGQWSERLNTFGCDQQDAAAAALEASCNNLGESFNGLDNDATWDMLRVGATGDVMSGRWKVSGEIAYVYGIASATDWHNQRPDIRGMREDSKGDGVQAEVMVSYFLTPSFSLGVGGRYWYISGEGKTHFEDKGGVAQVVKLESERYGLLVQGSLKLDEDGPVSFKDTGASPVSWRGGYVGVNLGYGSSSSRDDINGASAQAYHLTTSPNVFDPLDIGILDFGAFSNVETKGFLGGGTLGYNYQLGRSTVLGLEGDLDWAHLSGSTGFVTPASINYGLPILTSANREINWLATIRARAGYLASSRLLIYATGGAAFGGTKLSLNVRDSGTAYGAACGPATAICSQGTSSGTSVGYALGGGLEYKISEGISLKGEYLYVDLGSRSVTTTDTGAFAALGLPSNFKDRVHFDSNIVRLGLNYQLNSSAEPLK